MFDSLSEKLDGAFKNLKGDGKLTEINVAQSIKEIRRALVGADVNYKIAKEFTDKIKDKAMGQANVLTSIKPGELMVKIVMDEMTELMGGEAVGVDLNGKPTVILIAGLQGSGKTTFTGKISKWLKEKKNKKVLVTACDVYRPAAIDQLTVLAEQVGVDIYKEPENKNPVEIAQNAIVHAVDNKLDVVIVDTAGRLAVDEEMMNEIAAIKDGIDPNETLFVVDSMTGQDAVNTAKAFNERIDYTGVVLTKLDGDTRGGAALSVKYTVGKPIKFISTGEKMDQLDMFYPERMAQRILGMGDIVSFVERAQDQFDEKEAAKLEKKIKKNKMIPGMGKMTKNLDIDNNAFAKVESIIQSMTPHERENPETLNMSRKKRIARGCGRNIHEINMFIKQFDQMKKMMHMMSKGNNMQNMMRNLQNMGGGKGMG